MTHEIGKIFLLTNITHITFWLLGGGGDGKSTFWNNEGIVSGFMKRRVFLTVPLMNICMENQSTKHHLEIMRGQEAMLSTVWVQFHVNKNQWMSCMGYATYFGYIHIWVTTNVVEYPYKLVRVQFLKLFENGDWIIQPKFGRNMLVYVLFSLLLNM